MKTEWDYTNLAKAYVDRPAYADEAIDEWLRRSSASSGTVACDVGAGVGHLTIPLLTRGLIVDAVEPNDAMRALGIERTRQFPNVKWFEGTGEETGRPSGKYDLVSFGSSFNVTDRERSLKETKRLLKSRGWFSCMWNHRDLDDDIQKAVEDIIRRRVANYSYGSRREDQAPVIRKSGLFQEPIYIEGKIVHSMTKESWVEAWRSHATLARQAGADFESVIAAIQSFVQTIPGTTVKIPYVTRMWIAQASE